MIPSLPLHVEPVASATAGAHTVSSRALVFRYDGRLHVTVMAKVVLDLVQNRPMRLAPITPTFRDADVIDGRGAALSVSDARPLLRRTDVTYVGSAQAPAQNPVRRLLVRFALVRPVVPGGPLEGGVVLFDKSLGVIGPRFATAGQPSPLPNAFVRLPISYSLTLGGSHDPQNPIGVGREPTATGTLPLPSIVPASEAHAESPLGYGPIPKAWPARSHLTVETQRERITDLPTGLDFELFQAAPADQRVELLRGDEWVYLENLHPRFPRLTSRLPSIVSEARVDTGNDTIQRLPLRIDGVAILGDEGRVEVTCSGALSLADDALLGRLAICAAITTNGEEPLWPLPREAEAALPARPNFSTTLILELPPEPAPQARPGTMVIEMEESPATQVFSSKFERSRDAGTDAPPSTHAPFRVGKPRSQPNRDAAPIPGAPWEEPAPVAIRPKMRAPIDDPPGSAPPHTQLIPAGQAEPPVMPAPPIHTEARSHLINVARG